jgi:hypothetical protein
MISRGKRIANGLINGNGKLSYCIIHGNGVSWESIIAMRFNDIISHTKNIAEQETKQTLGSHFEYFAFILQNKIAAISIPSVTRKGIYEVAKSDV